MEVLISILKEYGPWGLLLVVLVFMVLKGQLTFRYPRSGKPMEED